MEDKDWKDTDWYKEIKKNHQDCFFNQYWVKTIIRDEKISEDSKYRFLDYLIDESTKSGYSQSNNNPKKILEEDVELIPAELRNKAAEMQIKMYKEGKYSILPDDLEKIVRDRNLSERVKSKAKRWYDKSASIELVRKKQSEDLTIQVINSALHRMNGN